MSLGKLLLSPSSSSSSESTFGPLQVGGISDRISVVRVMKIFVFAWSVCTLDNLVVVSWVPALLLFSRVKYREADIKNSFGQDEQGLILRRLISFG